MSDAVVAGSTLPRPAMTTREGEADGDIDASVTVVLRRRMDLAGRIAMIRSAPAGARAHLDHHALDAEHGAHPDDVAALTAVARRFALTVGDGDAVGPCLRLHGHLGDLGRAFGASIGVYRTEDGRTHRGYDGELSIPAGIAGSIVGVFGLDTRPLGRPQFIVLGPAAAGVGNTAVAVARTYGVPAGASAAGQRIGIIELGGGYVVSDVRDYATQLSLPAPALTDVSVDGGSNSPSSPVPSEQTADGEVALDIDVVAAVAPGASITVYFAPNTEQGFIDAITRAAKDGCTAISISWGAPGADWTAAGLTALDQACQGALALGTQVFAAAGDHGSNDGLTDGRSHADFPASSPHVIGCGGTSLPGLVLARETAWNDLVAGGGAGGGAVSDVWPLPDYQKPANPPPSVNDGQTRRTVPDLAGDAAPATGFRVLIGGSWYVLGGTSAVAPLIAAMHALLGAAVESANPGQRIGDFSSLLYAKFGPSGAMHDITAGGNGQYSATAGYDAVTGWGTPDFGRWRQITLGGP